MILVLKQAHTPTEKYQLTIDQTVAYLPGLSPVENKELCARFDGGRLSSDGGVLILGGIEKRLGLGDLLAGCLPDPVQRSNSRVLIVTHHTRISRDIRSLWQSSGVIRLFGCGKNAAVVCASWWPLCKRYDGP